MARESAAGPIATPAFPCRLLSNIIRMPAFLPASYLVQYFQRAIVEGIRCVILFFARSLGRHMRSFLSSSAQSRALSFPAADLSR